MNIDTGSACTPTSRQVTFTRTYLAVGLAPSCRLINEGLLYSRNIVTTAPFRTTIGAITGSLKSVPATDLATAVVKETLTR